MLYTAPMATARTLKALHDKYHAQNTCSLKQTATRPVYGHGNPHARIVFIGEAPGKKEDMTGLPFVGASGKFLDEMLASINIHREHIYITSIVKYRPPNNRDPKPVEKDACRDWLHAELTLINPDLIVFLGRHSMNDFFPTHKISKVHGKLLKQKFPHIATTHFLPLYHPAAALYNGKLRNDLLKDFKKIPHVLQKIIEK